MAEEQKNYNILANSIEQFKKIEEAYRYCQVSDT